MSVKLPEIVSLNWYLMNCVSWPNNYVTMPIHFAIVFVSELSRWSGINHLSEQSLERSLLFLLVELYYLNYNCYLCDKFIKLSRLYIQFWYLSLYNYRRSLKLCKRRRIRIKFRTNKSNRINKHADIASSLAQLYIRINPFFDQELTLNISYRAFLLRPTNPSK